VCVCVPIVIINYTFFLSFLTSITTLYLTISIWIRTTQHSGRWWLVDALSISGCSLLSLSLLINLLLLLLFFCDLLFVCFSFLFCVSCSSFYLFKVCIYLFTLVYFYRTDKPFPFFIFFCCCWFVYSYEMNHSEQGVCVTWTYSPLFWTVMYCAEEMHSHQKSNITSHIHTVPPPHHSSFLFLYFSLHANYAYSFLVRTNTFSFVLIFLNFSLILFHRLALLVFVE
jgi:hypothetical protein